MSSTNGSVETFEKQFALDFVPRSFTMRNVNELMKSPRGKPGEVRSLPSVILEQGAHRSFLDNTLLRPGQVAAMFQVSRRAVAEWARAGLIPWISTPGGHRRFRAGDVRKLVESLTVEVTRPL
ncbi:MAG: helix-turn-helix domain-containing protein [Actinomycetota bacterium]